LVQTVGAMSDASEDRAVTSSRPAINELLMATIAERTTRSRRDLISGHASADETPRK
jgi:hypothetical protein